MNETHGQCGGALESFRVALGVGPHQRNQPSPRDPHLAGARGGATPPTANVTALASGICKDFSRAGRDLYAFFAKGGAQADVAAAAVGAANCTDDAVPNALTVSAVAAQEASKGVADVESYFKKVATAFGDVGVPACITLLESDDAGVKVVKETYYTTD